MGSEAQAALAVGRECEASPDIIGSQVGEIVQHFLRAHAASKIVEDVCNGDASAANTRLPRSNARVNGNPVQVIHELEINAHKRSWSRRGIAKCELRIANFQIAT